MSHIRTLSQMLLCQLTEEELKQESRKLTDLLLEKSRLEDAKAAEAKYYSEQIKDLEAQIEQQIPIVKNNQKERMVTVNVEFNTPEKGFKTSTRMDTEEIISVDPMTESEIQDLFIDAESPEIISWYPDIETKIICEHGKLYSVDGLVGRCRAIAHGENCSKCAFVKNCPENDLTWDCKSNDCIFDLEKSPEPKADICYMCGAINTLNGNKILHITHDKQICLSCLAVKNDRNLKKVSDLEKSGHQVLFRPMFGFGCTPQNADTTCFRFMGAGHSWGLPVYKAGDYEIEGTDANLFYSSLCNRENFKED